MSTSGSRLGIMGGTFDPIHLGHLIVASELRASLQLDRILLMPNARSPFKIVSAISSANDRLSMLRLAVSGIDWLEVSTAEIDREGVSYTVETLALLAAHNPMSTLMFLMGADSLHDLPRWKRPNEILALAEIGVASRPGIEIDIAGIILALPAAAGRVTIVSTPAIEISATDIRYRVRAGRPITFHVPAAVERYILTHRLYLD